jgi:hypothetical protein
VVWISNLEKKKGMKRAKRGRKSRKMEGKKEYILLAVFFSIVWA